MATNKTESIVLTNGSLGAKIVLDWDDGQWYISDIQGPSDPSNPSTPGSSASTASNSGVKVPVWDQAYKYEQNDIVALEGLLYVSSQNVNQGNKPNIGTFWWKPLVNLTTVDAITLEGKNLKEIIRSVLSGNDITDYYKKSEVDLTLLSYFNNVNAKQLGGVTLESLQRDYNQKITQSKDDNIKDIKVYLNADGPESYMVELIDAFEKKLLK